MPREDGLPRLPALPSRAEPASERCRGSEPAAELLDSKEHRQGKKEKPKGHHILLLFPPAFPPRLSSSFVTAFPPPAPRD